MADPTPLPSEILGFWRDAGPDRWFNRDDAFDAEIRARFLAVHEAAARGECDAWIDAPEGALALLILLDQFPRNMFRDSARAFATDTRARAVAASAIARGHDQRFENPLRRFFYLPMMHSEDLAEQDACLAACAAAGDDGGVKFARLHRDIIARFGRFPHRNAVLGRMTAAEEQAFLDGGGFTG